MALVKINKDITKGIFEKVAAEAEKRAAEEKASAEKNNKDQSESDDDEEPQGNVTILGIESSCDETAAAVVVNGRQVLSNVIYSQVPVHTLYGGVVPEIASRAHVEKINQVIRKALSDSGKTMADIDAIAVTYGPGLVGPLLVGVNTAKAYAYAEKKPLVAVNHIEGHISANYIDNEELVPPFMCLVASGGH